MAEVGVLNLRIKADTTEAESGLDRIIGVLRSFKTEVSNANLGSVANALKRITKVINESVNDTTISRLQQMTDALAKLKGLENISINLRYSEQISRAAEGLQRAVEAANAAPQRNVDNGFSNAKDSIEEMKNNLDDMNASVEDTKGSYEYIQDEIRTAVDLESEWLKNARELNQVYADRYRALPQRSIEDMFNGMYWKRNDDGSYSKYQRENDMMSNWLRGNGTENEFLSGVGVIANKFDMSIADVKKKLEELMRPISRVRNEIQNLFDTLNQPVKFNWSEGIDRMMNIGGPSLNAQESYSAFYDAIQNGTGPLADQLRDLNPELAQDAQQFNTFEDAVSGIKDTADEATGELEDLDNELKKKKEDAEEASSAFERFSTFITELKANINTAVKPFRKLGNEIWRMIKRMAIRAAIRGIVGDVKEAVENVYHYSESIGSSFAPAMDSAAQSLQVMRNSIGAMLAPLLEALIPVLQTVVGWFTELVNYANQFFSLLRGQATWTRAVPTTVKAFDDQEKSAKGAAAAIKDLLADWDELNIIQSNTAGGGSGSSTKEATDYLSMFEEVGEFDNKIKDIVGFIKDNFKNILNLAKDIMAAVLAWRLSNALIGTLSDLAALAAIGYIIKVTFDAAVLLDKAYVESGNAGYLIGDAIMTSALAGIAGWIANAHFGETAGLIAAGVTFAVSAGASFSVAKGVADESKQKMLDLLGQIKFGISAALLSAGFIMAGFGGLFSAAMGVISAGIITYITYSLAIKAQNEESAAEMAKKAFAETGEGGTIKVQDYLDELQTEFDRITAGAHLVLDAYITVPNLQGKLFTAMTQITAFNQMIFHGAGKLTESDAQSFKDNWKMIMETLNEMNTASYQTILAGLTEALNTKSEEIRKFAEETRTSFIMLEKDLSGENAEIWKKMDDLVNKIAGGDTSKDTLDEYERYYKVFAAATRTGLDEINKALEESERFDFGDKDTAIDNAHEYMKNVAEATKQARQAEDDAFADIKESVERYKRIEEAKYKEKLIDKDVYDARIAALNSVIEVAEKYNDEKQREIDSKMQEAYDIVFKQALSSPNAQTEEYWEKVLVPLMKEAKEAGYQFPEELRTAFTEGAVSLIEDFGWIDPEQFAKELKEQGITDPVEIAKLLKEGINSTFGEGNDALGWIASVFGSNYNKLTPTQLEASQLLDIEGWDFLTLKWKQAFTDSLSKAFGSEMAAEILNKLGVSVEESNGLLLDKRMQKLAEPFIGTFSGLGEQLGDLWNSGKEGLSSLLKTAFPGAREEIPESEAVEVPFYLKPAFLLSIDELKKYVRDKVLEAAQDDDLFTEEDRRRIIEEAGIDEDFMREITDTINPLDLSGKNAHRINPYGARAAATTVSDVGGMGYANFTTSNTAEQNTQDQNNVEVGVKRGMKEANQEQEGLLRSLLTQMQLLNQKKWTVNITPTANAGGFFAKANTLYNMVTGKP